MLLLLTSRARFKGVDLVQRFHCGLNPDVSLRGVLIKLPPVIHIGPMEKAIHLRERVFTRRLLFRSSHFMGYFWVNDAIP
jgi:hypothetical protein